MGPTPESDETVDRRQISPPDGDCSIEMRSILLLAPALLALTLSSSAPAPAEPPADRGEHPEEGTERRAPTRVGTADGADEETAGPAADRAAPPAAAEAPIALAPALRPAPEERAAMLRWHRLYDQRFAAVKESWAQLLDALAAAERERVPTTCRRLERGLAGLDPPTFLPVPDPTIDLHFKRTLGDLQRVVASCHRGRWFELSHRLEVASRSFVQTAALIRRYGLEP